MMEMTINNPEQQKMKSRYIKYMIIEIILLIVLMSIFIPIIIMLL